MDVTRRRFLAMGTGATAVGLGACAQFGWRDQGKTESATEEKNAGSAAEEEPTPTVDLKEFKALELDMGAWSYDEERDCYYQLGIPYCLEPSTATYESLAIFVPGAYFTGKRRMSGTYTCEVAPEGKVGDFTPATAPVALPINSAHFEAQACPTSFSYEGISRYLTAGFVYVYAGFRGRSATVESGTSEVIAGGAPWPVVDLKAAVRYLRYNKASLPCDTERIFAFGFGGGGGIASCLGAMGDAPIYTDYLALVGAATHDGVQGDPISDAICGAAMWCPTCALDAADASYEWMMGQFSSEGQRAEGVWTRQLSRDLARSYGPYINELELVDGEGVPLTLDAVEDGDYLSGTYYEHVLDLIEDSASDFFQTTTFPYTYTPSSSEVALFPGDPNLTASTYDSVSAATDASVETVADEASSALPEGVRTVQSTVYETLESYVASLNSDNRWLAYAASAQRASVTDLWNFVVACRPARDSIGAFDALDRSSITNQLLGIGEETSLHYDATVASLLSANREAYAQLTGWDDALVSEWAGDLVKVDAQGFDMATRVHMMSPLYYLSAHYTGFETAQVAPHWRVNVGLFSNASSLTDQANLASALGAYDGVKGVELNVVWGAGFEPAEKRGNAEENLVAWIQSCCKDEGGDQSA